MQPGGSAMRSSRLYSRSILKSPFKIVGDKPGPAVLALRKKKGRAGDWPGAGHSALSRRVFGSRGALRSGGGTRLKILEAMAMGRPVVSTYQGAEGLEITDGVNILLADTPEDFARYICALIADPQLGRQLGAAGRYLVESKYDWKTCLSRLQNFYQLLLGDAAKSPRFAAMSVSPRLMTSRKRLSICYAAPGQNLLPSAGPTRNVLNVANALSQWADVTVAFRSISRTYLHRPIQSRCNRAASEIHGYRERRQRDTRALSLSTPPLLPNTLVFFPAAGQLL